MSNTKKRILIFISGLALAFIMGAAADAAFMNADRADSAAGAIYYAEHEDGNGGG